jgi:predicted alpha/beta hydrolase family esterase
MASAPARPYLFLHGLEGSGEGHWQRWLAARLIDGGETVLFPDLPNPDDPAPGPWEDELAGVLDGIDRPPVVLAHSLGCLLWLRHASRASGQLAERVLLVAPPAVETVPAVVRFSDFEPDAARVHTGCPDTRIVCSDEDPYNPVGAVSTHAEPLGVPADVIPGAGHLNVDAGYGPWPAVERWALSPQRGAAARGPVSPGRTRAAGGGHE